MNPLYHFCCALFCYALYHVDLHVVMTSRYRYVIFSRVTDACTQQWTNHSPWMKNLRFLEAGFLSSLSIPDLGDWPPNLTIRKVINFTRHQGSTLLHLHTEIGKRRKFILKLAKALLAFGAPSHRIESQLTAAATILGVSAGRSSIKQ